MPKLWQNRNIAATYTKYSAAFSSGSASEILFISSP